MLDNRKSENTSGTGLGLYISKKFSEKLTYEGGEGLKVEYS
jgi:signal transduction histidine kinase